MGRSSMRQMSRGAAMMEYVLIAVVVGAVVLFALSRFGGSIGGRWGEASKRVESTTSTGGGSSTRESGSAAGSGETGGQAAGGRGPAGPAERSIPAAPPEEEPTPDMRPRDGRVRVGNFAIDFSTIIWLAGAIVVVVVLIIVQIFKAARKKPKPKLS